VLKSVSLHVPPGTTLGVVGRTGECYSIYFTLADPLSYQISDFLLGSGKSSLLLTLFRLVEVERGGNIEIDGIDIRSVSLQTLRQSLSIIPQDPILFAGTIMYNLDATGKASQEDAWAALEAASPELAHLFRNTGGLDTIVTEGGKNLSLGQRQLICLARALLRKSKILILDEATASIDRYVQMCFDRMLCTSVSPNLRFCIRSATDQLVQATIRREFVDKGVTVITVAHRLETVLGYDKIAVLGSGELLEYGTPKKLLQIPDGELRQLVQADQRRKQLGAKTKPDKLPETRELTQDRVQVLAQ
jgi:ABC-type multidrug transport system fused ATPase/permease subunit